MSLKDVLRCMIFKELHEFMHNFIHDMLLVLIESLYDEFILHSRTNVPKGESIVKPRKVPVPKMPFSRMFYKGRIIISHLSIFPRLYGKSEAIFVITVKKLVGEWSQNNFRTSRTKIEIF